MVWFWFWFWSNQQICDWLKGGVCMLPWHAIPFLKGLGMLTPNPWENGWPRLWRSCNWQKNTQLNHSMAPKEPYRESEWADVSPLLKYISGAVAPCLKAPKGPYQASLVNSVFTFHHIYLKIKTHKKIGQSKLRNWHFYNFFKFPPIL